VCVFEVRDDKLVAYREYWNPLVSIEAHGGLDEWLAARRHDAGPRASGC